MEIIFLIAHPGHMDLMTERKTQKGSTTKDSTMDNKDPTIMKWLILVKDGTTVQEISLVDQWEDLGMMVNKENLIMIKKETVQNIAGIENSLQEKDSAI